MTDRGRVVVIDDHPPLREGLAAIVARSEEFTVAGTAGSAEEGLQLVVDTVPDVVIVDLALPDGNGVGLIRRVREEFPDMRILVLTMHARGQMVDAAFEAGANGYLLKESGGQLLLQALGRLVRGERFLDPKMVSAREQTGCDDGAGSGSDVARLSPREREVFEYLAVGHTAKEIANSLHISAKTVDNHRARIMEKLCISSMADLVRLAIRAGVIEA